MAKKTAKKRKKKRKLPEGFGAAKGDLLGRMIQAGVNEDQIPFIMDWDRDEGTANLSLVELEAKFTGITKLCDKARATLLDKLEQSIIDLALGGVITERKWNTKTKKWIPYKQKDVLPHFEAVRWVLAQWRPEGWAPNHNTDDLLIFDDLKGAEPDDVETRRITKFAGLLIESCTARRTSQSGVPQTDQQSGQPGSGLPEKLPVDVEAEPGVGVQDSILDVQPERADGDAEDTVHHLADTE